MRYVPRAFSVTIRRAMSTFPAVLITYARQTDKTTLVCSEFGELHHYFSLERLDILACTLADSVAFVEAADSPLILDNDPWRDRNPREE